MTQIKYDEEPGYLIAEVIGQWEQKDAEKNINDIRDELIRRGKTRLLLDLRGLSPSRSMMTHFFTGEHTAKVLTGRFRLAVIATREIRKGGFGENVAVNRGATLRTFFNKETALEWLLKGSNKANEGDGL